MKWMYALRARLRLVPRGGAEERMEEEIRFHIEMEEEKNLRAGMSTGEARRQAVLAFGGVEGHKEELRGGRTLAWVGGLSLDLKLAWRMLVNHRWLSLVGGLGIALAVAIGTIFFGVQDAILHSTLPFEEGERVIALEVRDTEGNEPERRILHELALWREELRSVEEISAWRPATRNLIVPGGAAGPVEIAEMSASGFRAARVPALLGRTLVQEDELPGAPAVAVLGRGIWRSRFGGDPDVVGREVRLGNVPHTVVGVMPEGFAFPVSHELWVPLRVDGTPAAPRAGPEIFAFGRLAPGATMESAGAEIATLGQRMAAAYPDTHARLRPRAVPYTKQSLTPAVYLGFSVTQTLTILLLVVVCVNIAVLVHARTATRTREIAVRSALGASRRRIVGQLFAEALVLALVSTMAGVAVAGLILEWAEGLRQELGGGGELSFWMQLGLTPAAVLYALALAAASAVIVGVIPALKVTGRRLRPGLDQTGGAGGLRLGGTWTAQIVGQVAIATAILPAATFGAWDQFQSGFDRPEFAAAEFLTAWLEMESETAGNEAGEAAEAERAARFDDRVRELTNRLEADPSVAYVTFARHSVGSTLPAGLVIEDLPPAPDAPGRSSVRTNEVDIDLFDALEVPVLEGRGFRPSDLAEGATPVIVNRAFVDDVLGGRNAIGREMRYTWRHGWSGEPRVGTDVDTLRRHEIVGVVGDQLVVGTDPGEAEARVYHPTAPGRLGALSLAVRIRGGAPAEFAPRLRELTATLDPTLQLHDILPLDELLRQEQSLPRFLGGAIAAVTLSVILLSAAGIHALMSFTITRRRREIGIRAALGARPARLLAGVFSRAAGQIAIGLVVGLLVATLLNDVTGNLTRGQATLFMAAAAALMAGVGLLAALGPARRGLRVEPMEALRAE
jgi:putative ABC transport system permease protein